MPAMPHNPFASTRPLVTSVITLVALTSLPLKGKAAEVIDNTIPVHQENPPLSSPPTPMTDTSDIGCASTT